ncbi:MAG: hypothetical protein LBL26_00635 [Peptococcaceae bacterium]|nr:hypothetical protein [Peptococcaceae bacterium]
MDGIAVISARTAAARTSKPLILRYKEDFVLADTGDPVRPPYDAVIMAEDLEELEDGSLRIRAAAAPWQHVRPVGEDIVQGEMIYASPAVSGNDPFQHPRRQHGGTHGA